MNVIFFNLISSELTQYFTHRQTDRKPQFHSTDPAEMSVQIRVKGGSLIHLLLNNYKYTFLISIK